MKQIIHFNLICRNPTPVEDHAMGIPTWPQLKSNNLQYLNINSTLTTRKNPKKYLEIKEILEAYMRGPFNVYWATHLRWILISFCKLYIFIFHISLIFHLKIQINFNYSSLYNVISRNSSKYFILLPTFYLINK